MPEELPVTKNVVDHPRDWDTAVSAAYIRIIGGTQEQAAAAAGCSVRSLRNWEASEFWMDAKREAEDRWLNGLVAHSRKTLVRAMEASDGDPGLALKILERLDDRLRPAKVGLEHSGPDGGPIEANLSGLSEEDIRAQAAKLAARLSSGECSA